jgi:predicted neutral ceramidase superfamily lipid hydrolase
MSKLKKTISSASFSINRFYRRISTAKPSTLILSIVTIAFAVFLFGGGLYDIITPPLPAVFSGQRFYLIYPQLSEQFMSDSLLSMILYSFGIIGLIAIYQSTKHAYKPRQAYMMFIVGLVLVLITYIFLEVILQYKMNPGQG